MGATKAALAITSVLSVVATPSRGWAECVERSSHGPFTSCFDVGNRAWVAGGSTGVAAGIDLRHRILFADEPDLVWKLSHRLARVGSGSAAGGYRAELYSGRYLRHARDGHIVVPVGRPRKIFLPFDIGAEAAIGSFSRDATSELLEVGLVRAAPLIELLRSPRFQRRLALGPVARWDALADVAARDVVEHRVSPFSMMALSAYLESSSGLTVAELNVEGGTEWSRVQGWRWEVRAVGRLERTLLALNDRPLSIFVGARYRRSTDTLIGELGLRLALVQRRDGRVHLGQ